MRKLTRLSLVIPRRDGNRLYYSADQAHPLYPVIHELVLKTSGLVSILYEAMCDQSIDVAFVFGSVARGDETAVSDVDLMVIGNIGMRDMAGLLAGLTETIGREINPHVMTKSEYNRRKRNQDHFTMRVLEGPKMFVIGNADEFEALGK
jgi:predicted nucleotidyltransferase